MVRSALLFRWQNRETPSMIEEASGRPEFSVVPAYDTDVVVPWFHVLARLR